MRCLPVLGALAVLFAGCSKEPYETAPVSGRITLNGKPVANVAITFQPVAPEGNINPGPGSHGRTDADGRYTLKLIGKETSGAVVGKHKVRIQNFNTEDTDPGDDRPKVFKPPVPIPAKYNTLEGMDFVVPAGGTSTADFALTGP